MDALESDFQTGMESKQVISKCQAHVWQRESIMITTLQQNLRKLCGLSKERQPFPDVTGLNSEKLVWKMMLALPYGVAPVLSCV